MIRSGQLKSSTAQPSVKNIGCETIVPRNFAPGFKVFLMNKDLETFYTIAKELHVPVSFSNVAQRYQQAAMAAGLADQDTSVALTIIEKLAALD